MPQRLQEVECLRRGVAVVDDPADRLDHRDGVIALEDVPAHVDAGGALVDRPVRHLQGVALRQLLAARHDDGHRTAGRHLLEALVAVVGLDNLRAELGTDARREPQVAAVADELATDGGHPQNRDAASQPFVDEPGHVDDGLRLVFAADEDLHRHGGRAEPDRVVDVQRDVLVRELAEDRRATARPHDETLLDGRRNHGAEDPPGEHQGVRIWHEGQDADVHALEPGRRALEVAVVDGQHRRAAAPRPEDTCQAVLHPPVVGRGSLQEERFAALRDVLVELLGAAAICLGHVMFTSMGGC